MEAAEGMAGRRERGAQRRGGLAQGHIAILRQR